VTDGQTDGRTEGQNYDSQDRASTAASRGKNHFSSRQRTVETQQNQLLPLLITWRHFVRHVHIDLVLGTTY